MAWRQRGIQIRGSLPAGVGFDPAKIAVASSRSVGVTCDKWTFEQPQAVWMSICRVEGCWLGLRGSRLTVSVVVRGVWDPS
jgi:hypothetical protein